jgi:hypothetical protein
MGCVGEKKFFYLPEEVRAKKNGKLEWWNSGYHHSILPMKLLLKFLMI